MGRSGYLAWAKARGAVAPLHSIAAAKAKRSRRFIESAPLEVSLVFPNRSLQQSRELGHRQS
jgi:hypothetical protein